MRYFWIGVIRVVVLSFMSWTAAMYSGAFHWAASPPKGIMMARHTMTTQWVVLGVVAIVTGLLAWMAFGAMCRRYAERTSGLAQMAMVQASGGVVAALLGMAFQRNVVAQVYPSIGSTSIIGPAAILTAISLWGCVELWRVWRLARAAVRPTGEAVSIAGRPVG